MLVDTSSIILLLASGLIFLGVVYSLMGPYPLIGCGVGVFCLWVAMVRSYREVRRRGLISFLGPKARSLLLERSLLDILRDIIYFPYITKIIATFVSIATYKPHPDQVPQLIRQLPKQVELISTRKGLLSLSPAALESLVLPEDRDSIVSEHYGQSQEVWDRMEEYRRVDAPVHEETWEQRLVHLLDSKMGWPFAVLLLGVTLGGAYQMHPRRFRKMMVQNLTFCCLVLSIMAIVIKLRRLQHRSSKAKRQLNNEEIRELLSQQAGGIQSGSG